MPSVYSYFVLYLFSPDVDFPSLPFFPTRHSSDLRILVEEGGGEPIAHGSSSSFLIVQRRHRTHWTSLVLIQDEHGQGRIDPWFVRSTDYIGIGTSLAWSEPREVALGQTLDVRVHALILDHAVTAAEVEELLAEVPTSDSPRPDQAPDREGGTDEHD